jgi:hypothetical protein
MAAIRFKRDDHVKRASLEMDIIRVDQLLDIVSVSMTAKSWMTTQILYLIGL